MKIKLIRSTIVDGKRVSLKEDKKTGGLTPQVVETTDREARFLIQINKALPADKAEKKPAADKAEK